MITEAEAFDSYQRKGIENGQKSLAISVTFQPKNATLTDADIESLSSKVVKAVEKATGGQLRG
jgi:phenylalanyl-tRNA synthetase beta chain